MYSQKQAGAHLHLQEEYVGDSGTSLWNSREKGKEKRMTKSMMSKYGMF
jgi:hypothetical protein